MSSTNKTSNYELSQFLATDVPSWLVDYNGDNVKIDTQMKANAVAAAAAQSKADGADGKADANAANIATLDDSINHEGTGLAARITDVEGDVDTIESLIGNGTPTTTDQTIIGAINELDDDLNGAGGVSTIVGNTPLTTTAQTVTGAINELNSVSTARRKFILIGDSFGYGVVGGGAPQGTGWLAGFANNQPAGTVFYLTSEEVAALEGTAGFCSTLTFQTILETIYTTKLGTTNPNEITDIVVLGGTNDYGAGATSAQLDTAIKNFMTYANAHFPKAKTKIGVLGKKIHDFILAGIPNGYAQCMQYNAEYIEDTFGLMIVPQYYSTDGTHITADGYTFYQKYINEAIVCGRCSYNFQFKVAATIDSTVIDTPPSLTAWIDHNNHSTKVAFSYANDSYKEWPVAYVTPAANGTSYSNFITLANAVEFPKRYQVGGNWQNISEITADSKKVENPAQHAYYYVADKTHFGLNVGNTATPVTSIDRMLIQIDPAAATYVEYAPY